MNQTDVSHIMKIGALFSEIYKDDALSIWLCHPNTHLGKPPLELILEGDYETVENYLNALAEGVFM